jgi:histidinol-phosphate aminotransferase
MTRTFSKVFGLAGMRIGWMYGPPDIIDMVKRVGITFPISAPALAACLAVLEDTQHSDFVVSQNNRIRDHFSELVRGFGLKVLPSQTNFVLVRFGNRDASGAQAHFEKNGIVPRRLAAGDFADCIRFTIGTAEEMERVANCLEEWVNE